MIQKIAIILTTLLCITNVVMLSQITTLSTDATKLEKDMKRIQEEIVYLEAKVVEGSSFQTIRTTAEVQNILNKPSTVYMDPAVYALK